MGGVCGGWVGWLRVRGGVCEVGGEEGGMLSNLGFHFGVWKIVGLFQLKCNISSEHAPALWRSQLRLERQGIVSEAIFQYVLYWSHRTENQDNSQDSVIKKSEWEIKLQGEFYVP